MSNKLQHRHNLSVKFSKQSAKQPPLQIQSHKDVIPESCLFSAKQINTQRVTSSTELSANLESVTSKAYQDLLLKLRSLKD